MDIQAISIKDYARSQVDFLFAEFKGDPELAIRAADVITWFEGRFITVRDLVNQCGSHRLGGLVYEAWAYETARRVRAATDDLSSTSARAMTLYARYVDLYEPDADAMMDALREAQRALYGEM